MNSHATLARLGRRVYSAYYNTSQAWRAAASAVTVLTLGFGAMNLFWYAASQDPDLHGLYYYRAATVGDGIMVPLFIGASSLYVNRFPRRDRGHVVRVWLVGILGFICGAALQLQWLLSDSTGTNWTLPQVHHFNAAGWYHAAFLSVMVGVVAGRVVNILMLRNKHPQVAGEAISQTLSALVWFGGSGFLFLLMLDNYRGQIHAVAIICVTLAALFVLLVLISGISLASNLSLSQFLADVKSIAAGLIGASGVALLADGTEAPSVLAVIGATCIALLTIRLIPARETDIGVTLAYWPLAAVPAFALTLQLVGLDYHSGATAAEWLLILVLIFLTAATPAIVGRLFPLCEDVNDKNSVIMGSIVILGVALVLLIGRLGATGQLSDDAFDLDSTDALSAVLTIAIAFGAKGYIEKLWQPVKLGEDEEQIATEDTLSRKVDAYVRGASYAVAVALLLVVCLGQLTPYGTPWKIWRLPQYGLRDLGALGVLLVCLGGLLWLRGRGTIRSHLSEIVLGYILAIGAYAALVQLVNQSRRPAPVGVEDVFIVLVITGVALFVTESGIANGPLINNISLRPIRKYAHYCIVGLGSFMCMAAAFIPTVDGRGAPSASIASPVVGMFGIIVGLVLIPWLLLPLVLVQPIPETRVVSNSPESGVLQDGFMASLMAVFAGLIPLFLLASALSPDVPFNWRAFVYSYIPMAGSLSWFVLFTQRNNVDHLEGRRLVMEDLVVKNPSEAEAVRMQWQALRRHITFQNWISMLTLFPAIVALWAGRAFYRVKSGHYQDSDGEAQAWRREIRSVLPPLGGKAEDAQ